MGKSLQHSGLICERVRLLHGHMFPYWPICHVWATANSDRSHSLSLTGRGVGSRNPRLPGGWQAPAVREPDVRRPYAQTMRAHACWRDSSRPCARCRQSTFKHRYRPKSRHRSGLPLR
jgi:hypothetical protein